jgi:hypothetical protein
MRRRFIKELPELEEETRKRIARGEGSRNEKRSGVRTREENCGMVSGSLKAEDTLARVCKWE